MAINCEELSSKAREIFNKIKVFFPPDSYGKCKYTEDGKVFDNIWYDLRLSGHRQVLINTRMHFVGHIVCLQAGRYRKNNGGED